MNLRPAWLALSFALVAALGYWLARTAAPRPEVMPAAGMATAEAPRWSRTDDDEAVKFRRGERPPARKGDAEAALAGAIEGERILIFKDREAMEDFLKRAGSSIRVLGRLDALNALRVGFDRAGDLADLLTGEESESFVYTVRPPDPPEASAQTGAVPLGNRLLQWLGIRGGNTSWGKGVLVAVLDTGIEAHRVFANSIRSIDLAEASSDPAARNAHGTAVASVIAGNNPLTPGVAPGVNLLSVRIAGDSGTSNSFLLAQGIVAAVDAGANLVNISMGGFGDSMLVRNALSYAAERGVLVIAAVGNNGLEQPFYPAANEGVIAVGAVDANGTHLDFSNTGKQVDVAAPGYSLNAAWPGDQAAVVSGTSFSAPVITGAIAAVMTQHSAQRISAQQAWNLISSHLNDAGAPGSDPLLGAGMPDLGRVLDAGTAGIHDAALASQRILPPTPSTPNGELEVLIQNRGTEVLVNTGVNVTIGSATTRANLTTLPPNAVATVRVPVTPPAAGMPLHVDSQVDLSGGAVDAKPANDRRVESFGLPADD
jgi:Subtilase family